MARVAPNFERHINHSPYEESALYFGFIFSRSSLLTPGRGVSHMKQMVRRPWFIMSMLTNPHFSHFHDGPIEYAFDFFARGFFGLLVNSQQPIPQTVRLDACF